MSCEVCKGKGVFNAAIGWVPAGTEFFYFVAPCRKCSPELYEKAKEAMSKDLINHAFKREYFEKICDILRKQGWAITVPEEQDKDCTKDNSEAPLPEKPKRIRVWQPQVATYKPEENCFYLRLKETTTGDIELILCDANGFTSTAGPYILTFVRNLEGYHAVTHAFVDEYAPFKFTENHTIKID